MAGLPMATTISRGSLRIPIRLHPTINKVDLLSGVRPQPMAPHRHPVASLGTSGRGSYSDSLSSF